MGRLAGQEALHQLHGFAKGMPVLMVGMDAQQPRRSPVRDEKGPKEKDPAGYRGILAIAGTAAKARL